MKRILSVLFILVSFVAQAQVTQNLGAKNTVVKTPGNLIIDSVFNLRLLDTATSKLAFPSFLQNRLARQDGRLYIYNGTKFALLDSVTGGGGSGTVSSFGFTDGNGFDGTVTNSATTPTLVLTTQANNHFITDAQQTVLNNTSGTNTGDQTSVTGNAGTATALQTGRTIGILTGDATSSGSTFNGTANNTNAVTLATVNSSVGSFGSATAVPAITVNGKGLVTGVTSTSIQVAQSQVTSLTGDLAAKAPLASPTFTGTVTTPNITVTSLSSGSTNDSLVVADASTGALKRISSSRIASTPSTLPALPEISKVVDWFDASDITGVSDGASLSTWPNKISGGASLTAVNAPTYAANYKGMPAVMFSSASSQSMTFTSHTFKQCIIVGNNLDGSTFVSYAGLLTDAGASGFAWYADIGTSTTGMGKTTGTVTTQGFSSSNNSYYPLGRTKITELTEPAGIAATTLRLGGFYNSIPGRFWNGGIQEVIFLNAPLTAPAFNEWYRYLINKYRMDKAPFSRPDGNSIMIGGYSGVTTSQSVGYWINQYMRAYYDNDIDYVNKGVGGNTIAQQDFLARTVGGIDFEMGKQVIMGAMDIPFLGFTNDLHGAGDGVIAYNNMMTYCANRIKVNPNIKIWIIPPYSCDSAWVVESERQIVLQMLRDFKPTKNIRVQPSDDTLLYNPLACYTSGLFNADHIHPNTTGTQYAAKIFFDYYVKYKD